jgi:hypothetical protein
MKTLYYAHSKRTYGSRQEKRELKLIKKKFPDHEIVNPGEITYLSLHESEIMEECKGFVRAVDVIVCSEYKKYIGRGVFEELETKTKAKKYLLRGKKFIENFSVRIVDRDDWCVRYGKCEEV